MPDEYGIDLAPNTASSIGVQMNQIQRKPAPYSSHCMEDWTDTGLSVQNDTEYSLSVRSMFIITLIRQNNVLSFAIVCVTNQQ